jgi:xanthine dehydrogenase accessory factor
MELFEHLNEAINAGKPVALCTVVNSSGSVPRHAGAKMLVFPDGGFEGTVGGGETETLVLNEALAALKDGKTRFLNYDLIDLEKGDPGICGGTVTIYVEPFLRTPTVIVVGAGHVGRSVVHLASWMGYRVIVSDDRTDLCTPESVPDADEYLPIPINELVEKVEIGPQTYLVLVTRGVEVDLQGLPALLDTDAAYIGLIGSKRRWARCQEELLEAGIPQEKIDRIHSPVGLHIHAETPDEIAISIMAEITTVRNEGKQHYRKI